MKTSPTQQIVKLINEQPSLKAGEIIKTTGMEGGKVYRTLSYLVKTKKLSRRAGKYTIAYGLPMTAINPEQPTVQVQMPKPHVTAKVQNERKAMREQDLLHTDISELKNKIADLEEQLQDMSVKYYDALAVINYLEKFFSGKK